MTSRSFASVVCAGLTALFALAAIAVTVTAHGVCAAREIDQRALTDADAVAYGGPGGVASEGGHDIMAVDIREAHDALSGEPAAIFRIIVQGGDTTKGELKDVLSVKAAGSTKTFELSTKDGVNFASTFDSLAGPFPVCDAFPQALDGLVRYSTLGVTAGAKLDDITMAGYAANAPADIAPGSWYYGEQLVPGDPTSPGAPGSYVLKGPAQLLNVTAATNQIDLTRAMGPVEVAITLENALSSLEQFVNLTLRAPEGVSASLDSTSVKLAASGGEKTRTITLSVARTTAATESTLFVVASSDLGGRNEQEFMIMMPDAQDLAVNGTAQNQAVPSTELEGTGGQGGLRDAEDGPESPANVPAPGILAVAAGLLGAALVRRRRTAP